MRYLALSLWYVLRFRAPIKQVECMDNDVVNLWYMDRVELVQ